MRGRGRGPGFGKQARTDEFSTVTERRGGFFCRARLLNGVMCLLAVPCTSIRGSPPFGEVETKGNDRSAATRGFGVASHPGWRRHRGNIHGLGVFRRRELACAQAPVDS